MAPTDINPMRDRLIRLHGLTAADRPYTLYYDETNNCRRLHVTPQGFNVEELACFVLGGIGHAGPPKPLDIQALRAAVRLQANAKELKLEHLGWGGFLKIIGSKRMTAYLDWIAAQDLFVHYIALDPLYWACIDIVQAVLDTDAMFHMTAYHLQLKNDLYAVMRTDPAVVAELFYRFDFPAVAADGHAEFFEAVIDWVDAEEERLDEFNYRMLRDVLKWGRKADDLSFFEGEQPRTLVDSFAAFFIERFTTLKNARHILDVEKRILAPLRAADLHDGAEGLANYAFVDSEDEPGVQISDPIVGLIGKLLSYVAFTPPEVMLADRAALSPAQRGNLATLKALINRSAAENSAFLNTLMALDDHYVATWFLSAAEDVQT